MALRHRPENASAVTASRRGTSKVRPQSSPVLARFLGWSGRIGVAELPPFCPYLRVPPGGRDVNWDPSVNSAGPADRACYTGLAPSLDGAATSPRSRTFTGSVTPWWRYASRSISRGASSRTASTCMSRNEYNNISIDRASRILDALGVRMRSAFEQPLTNRTAA